MHEDVTMSLTPVQLDPYLTTVLKTIIVLQICKCQHFEVSNNHSIIMILGGWGLASSSVRHMEICSPPKIGLKYMIYTYSNMQMNHIS